VIAHGGGISGFVSETRYYPNDDLLVVMLVNTAGNLSPSALSAELVDVLLPYERREFRSFTGDTDPLVGTYSGASRGRTLTITVTATEAGLLAGPAGGRPTPLAWDEGWTFRLGPVNIVTFERDGESGPATVMRLDGGGSHYVLRRQPD